MPSPEQFPSSHRADTGYSLSGILQLSQSLRYSQVNRVRGFEKNVHHFLKG